MLAMRLMAVSLFLVFLAAMAAYMTRPGEAQHRGVARALSETGRMVPADPDGERLFDDFLVLTRSRIIAGGRVQLDCWGAYTRFLCMGEPGSAPAPAASGASVR
jgi:hypothetical protein